MLKKPMPCFVSSSLRRRSPRSSCVPLGRRSAPAPSAGRQKRLRRRNPSPKRRRPRSSTPRRRNQSQMTRWIWRSMMIPNGTKTARHPRLSVGESAGSPTKTPSRKVRRAPPAPRCSASEWRATRRATSDAHSILCIFWIRISNRLRFRMASRPRTSSRRRRLNSAPRRSAFARLCSTASFSPWMMLDSARKSTRTQYVTRFPAMIRTKRRTRAVEARAIPRRALTSMCRCPSSSPPAGRRGAAPRVCCTRRVEPPSQMSAVVPSGMFPTRVLDRPPPRLMCESG